jgi:hypothetical protein
MGHPGIVYHPARELKSFRRWIKFSEYLTVKSKMIMQKVFTGSVLNKRTLKARQYG